MMKMQLKIMGAFVEREGDPKTLTWLKLLFQRTLDSEISKMLDFYKFRADALREDVENLETKERHMLLSILNVCADRPLSDIATCSKPNPETHELVTPGKPDVQKYVSSMSNMDFHQGALLLVIPWL
jgi:hypothetical protein